VLAEQSPVSGAGELGSAIGPDPNNPGHYTTNPRYFYNVATGQIITM
jgi:hypothetical protein